MSSVVDELVELHRKKRITRRQFIKGLGALGLAMPSIQALLAGCAPKPKPSPTDTPASTTAAPKATTTAVPPTAAPKATPTAVPPTPAPVPGTATLTVAFPLGPNTLDPHFWTSFREQELSNIIFETLIAMKPDGAYYPLVAESWTRIDPNTWQFKIRKGVKFPDGTDFDASTVAYNVERVLDPELAATLYAPSRMKVRPCKVIDKYTVNFITEMCVAEIMLRCEMHEWGMVPESSYKGIGGEEATKMAVGSGPFSLVEWKKDEYLHMEAKPDHWNNQGYWGGPVPKFKTLIHRVIPEDSARIAALERGDVDIIYDVPMDQMKTVDAMEGLTSVAMDSDSRMFIGINQSKPFLHDVRVRQALNYAVDWEAINQSVFYGTAPRLSSWIAPRSASFNPHLDAYPYDPEKAKELLAEAGVPKGHKLELSVFPKVASGTIVAQAVAANYADVGLDVKVVPMEVSIMVKKLVDKSIGDLWLIAYGGGAAGRVSLCTLQKDFVLSAYHWDNPEWEEIYAALTGDACLLPDRHKQVLFELQRIAVEDPPVVYLCIQPKVYAFGPRVKQWKPRFDLNFYPWEVELAEGA